MPRCLMWHGGTLKIPRNYTPWRSNMDATWIPPKWGLEGDFPFQLGDFLVPAVNYPGCKLFTSGNPHAFAKVKDQSCLFTILYLPSYSRCFRKKTSFGWYIYFRDLHVMQPSIWLFQRSKRWDPAAVQALRWHRNSGSMVGKWREGEVKVLDPL